MSTETAVRERPILFSGPMVRAILDGSKTQTRRVVKPQPTRFPSHDEPGPFVWFPVRFRGLSEEGRIRVSGFAEKLRPFCPYGQPGDRLWVREAHGIVDNREFGGTRYVEYRADTAASHPGGWDNAPDDPEALRWRPSIHMPRSACRITLELTDVRVEWVQAISEADAIAEGVDAVSLADVPRQGTLNRRSDFCQLWNLINAKRGYGWDTNPWVWVVSFRALPRPASPAQPAGEGVTP